VVIVQVAQVVAQVAQVVVIIRIAQVVAQVVMLMVMLMMGKQRPTQAQVNQVAPAPEVITQTGHITVVLQTGKKVEQVEQPQ